MTGPCAPLARRLEDRQTTRGHHRRTFPGESCVNPNDQWGDYPVNHKRFYRVMKQHQLLPRKAPKRRPSNRPHEGTVAVTESDTGWCSDGVEIACDNGEVVTGTFTKDSCVAGSSHGGRGGAVVGARLARPASARNAY